jgi:hypothetical protein
LTGTIVAESSQSLENPTLGRVIGLRAQRVRQHSIEGVGEFKLRRGSSSRGGCGTDSGEVSNRAEFGMEGFQKEEETTARVRRGESQNPADCWILEELHKV